MNFKDYQTGYYSYIDNNNRIRCSKVHLVFKENLKPANVVYKIKHLPICGSKGLFINAENFQFCSHIINPEHITCQSCKKKILKMLLEDLKEIERNFIDYVGIRRLFLIL